MSQPIAPPASIPMHPVKSSNLSYVGYDEPSKCLFVCFLSGAVWRYNTVPKETHQGLMDAPSMGSYFHHNIKSSFPAEKIKG